MRIEARTTGAQSAAQSADNDAVRGDDDPLAVLPLDRVDAAETGQDAAGRDFEHAAITAFDQSTAAAHVLHDPVRQDFSGNFASAGVPAQAIEPVVSGAAEPAADARPFFFSSRSTASAMRASFRLGSICARSIWSSRSASLANWLPALRAAASRLL